LHLLREVLRPAAQGLERTALRVDGAVGIAIAKLALRITHGFAGLAKLLTHIALTRLALLSRLLLAETALVELFDQLVELIAQRLLLLRKVAHAVLVALLALLTLLTALAALTLLPALLPTLILTLLERTVAQLLLPPDHIAQLIELVHHVVVAVPALHLAGLRHLQVVEHRLQLLQELTRGILGSGTGHLLEPIDHVLEILRPQLAGVGIERTGELLRVLPQLLG